MLISEKIVKMQVNEKINIKQNFDGNKMTLESIITNALNNFVI